MDTLVNLAESISRILHLSQKDIHAKPSIPPSIHVDRLPFDDWIFAIQAYYHGISMPLKELLERRPVITPRFDVRRLIIPIDMMSYDDMVTYVTTLLHKRKNDIIIELNQKLGVGRNEPTPVISDQLRVEFVRPWYDKLMERLTLGGDATWYPDGFTDENKAFYDRMVVKYKDCEPVLIKEITAVFQSDTRDLESLIDRTVDYWWHICEFRQDICELLDCGHDPDDSLLTYDAKITWLLEQTPVPKTYSKTILDIKDIYNTTLDSSVIAARVEEYLDERIDNISDMVIYEELENMRHRSGSLTWAGLYRIRTLNTDIDSREIDVFLAKLSEENEYVYVVKQLEADMSTEEDIVDAWKKKTPRGPGKKPVLYVPLYNDGWMLGWVKGKEAFIYEPDNTFPFRFRDPRYHLLSEYLRSLSGADYPQIIKDPSQTVRCDSGIFLMSYAIVHTIAHARIGRSIHEKVSKQALDFRGAWGCTEVWEDPIRFS